MADSYVQVFFDWPEVTRALSAEEKGRLIDAMVVYARQGGDYRGIIEGNERFVFPLFQAQIDRSRTERTSRQKSGRENGRKGGRPQKGRDGKAAGAHAESDGLGFYENPNAQNDELGFYENPNVQNDGLGFCENPNVQNDGLGFCKNPNAENRDLGFQKTQEEEKEEDYEEDYEEEYEEDYDRGFVTPEEEDDNTDNAAGDAQARAQKLVANAWERSFGSPPNPATRRVVAQWFVTFGLDDPEVIDDAVAQTAMRNANDPVGYIVALVKDWGMNGIRDG